MAQPTYTKIPTTAAYREPTKRFLKLMEGMSRREGWRERDAFEKWLTCATSALAGPALKLQLRVEDFEKNEERYMAVVRASRHPAETMADMAQALAVVTEALEAEQGDFIGPIFSELSAHAGAGQFFTPWSLCQLMAEMNLSGAPARLEELRAQGRTYLLCSEPAVGAGGMVLAATQTLKAAGIDPARHVHWVCVDIEWRAFCAAYVQLSLCAVSATMVWGNTLTLEEWLVLPTIMAVLHPKRRETAAEPALEVAAAGPPEPEPEPHQAALSAQLSFDF